MLHVVIVQAHGCEQLRDAGASIEPCVDSATSSFETRFVFTALDEIARTISGPNLYPGGTVLCRPPFADVRRSRCAATTAIAADVDCSVPSGVTMRVAPSKIVNFAVASRNSPTSATSSGIGRSRKLTVTNDAVCAFAARAASSPQSPRYRPRGADRRVAHGFLHQTFVSRIPPPTAVANRATASPMYVV